MEALLATSFDRYARYTYVARLRAKLGSEPIRILDVGDPYGTLAGIFPTDHTVSLDLFAEGDVPAGPHSHVLGSGFALPFPPGAFDLVSCHDVFEHLPARGRGPFVAELLRVAQGPVVLVAPFHDPRVARCEQIVNAYYVARVGRTLQPLDEHAEGGLPDLAWLEKWLVDRDVDYEVHADGWLYHWLAMMLLKAHYVSTGAAALDRAADAAFNTLLRDRDQRAPHYRRALILRPPGAPTARPAGTELTADDPEVVEHDLDDLTALGWELARALPKEEDPSTPGSALRAWITEHRGSGGPRGELAESLDLMFDAARAALDVPPSSAPRPSPPPTTIVVLEARDTGRADALLAGLAATPGADDVVLVTDHPDRQPPTPVRVVVAPGTDLVARTNCAIEASDREIVVLLDASVRFESTDVAALAAACEPAAGVVCAGFSLTAEGTEAGAASAVTANLRVDGDEALFVSPRAMAVARSAYVEAAGIDGSLLGHLDALDFGWRLWIRGHRVRHLGVRTTEPAAGAPADIAMPPRWREERAYLRMLFKNLDDGHLDAWLAPEMLLLARRAAAAPAAGGGEHWCTEILAGMAEELAALADARAAVQSSRARTDDEIFDRFGRPGRPPCDDSGYAAALRVAEASWDLDAARSRTRPSALVVFASDDAPRATTIADALASLCTVTSAVWHGDSRTVDGSTAIADEADLARLVAASDIAVVPGRLGATGVLAARRETVVVVDLGDGIDEDAGSMDVEVLRRGDAFLCGSEAQRQHWLGRLAAIGRPTARERAVDPSLREMIDVVVTPAPAFADSAAAERPLGETQGDGLDGVAIASEAEGGRDARDGSVMLVTVDAIGLGGDLALALAVAGGASTLAARLPGLRVALHADADAEAAASRGVGALRAGGAPVAMGPTTPSGRAAALRSSALVVRAVGPEERSALGPAAPGVAALCAGTPIVATTREPSAWLVTTYGAGVVCEPTPEAVCAAALALLADPVRRAAARARAEVARAALRALHARLPAAVGTAPWRWQGAHLGGLPPRALPPVVRQTLDQAAVERLRLETRHRLELDDLRAEVERLSSEAALADEERAARDAELQTVRSRLERIDRHPAVRARRALRRLFGPST